MGKGASSEKVVREIQRRTRRRFSAEEKIRIIRVVDAALADPERSPRELAWQLTDRTGHFLSESSVYRILKAHDLITSPAFVVPWELERAIGRFVEHLWPDRRTDT
jgi:hypothetical protein